MNNSKTLRFELCVLAPIAVLAAIWPAAALAQSSAAGGAQSPAQKIATEPQQSDLLGAALAAQKKADEAKRKFYEKEVLQRARREREDRLKAERAETAKKEAAKREAENREAEKRRLAEKQERAKLAAEIKQARAEVARLTKERDAAREAARIDALRHKRDEDLRRLTDKLERSAAAREARKLASKAAAEAVARKRAENLRKQKEKEQQLAAAKAAREDAERRAAAAQKADAAREKREAQARADSEWRAAQIAREKEVKRRSRLRIERDRRLAERSFGNSGSGVDIGPGRGAGSNNERRVAVLLVMRPGNRGIRRRNKTADPLLCTPGGCYISTGSTYPARLVPRRRALGFFNTHGRRAGACNRRLGCIYRNVDLGPGTAYLQPVDLRLVRHDRRQVQIVTKPSRCTSRAGRLSCDGSFISRDYVMWVVPESVAASAGASALEDAVRGGLADDDRRWADLDAPADRYGYGYGNIAPY